MFSVKEFIHYKLIFKNNFIKFSAKTVTSMYVLQLTLTDSLFLFMLPFFAMYKLTNSWNFGLGGLIFLY